MLVARTVNGGAGSIKIQVKVVPGAATTEIVGWLGDKLKVRVSAAPEKGKANAAVEATIADALGISPAAVKVVAGARSAQKVVEIRGIDGAKMQQAFGHGDA